MDGCILKIIQLISLALRCTENFHLTSGRSMGIYLFNTVMTLSIDAIMLYQKLQMTVGIIKSYLCSS